MKSRADLFETANNRELKLECTNSDLATNNTIDGMIVSLIFRIPHKWTLHVNQYEVWPDNLVQQYG